MVIAQVALAFASFVVAAQATAFGAGEINNLQPFPGGSRGVAQRINDSGAIAGWEQPSGSIYSHGFRLLGGQAATDLGTFGGSTSYANGMNSSGVVVGEALNSSGKQHAFRYDGTGPTQDLGTLGGLTSIANAINDAGVIVGVARNAPGGERAFRWDGTGPMEDLGTLGGGSSIANDVNASGAIVGFSWTTAVGPYHGFRSAGSAPMQDLGTLPGGRYSNATGINDNGMIVGWSDDAQGFLRAVRWSNGPIQQLPTAPGGGNTVAISVNRANVAVGYSIVGADDHAVLWRADGSVVDLDAWLDQINPTQGACWSLAQARDINSSGLVVGFGYYNDGSGGLPDGQRPFVLDASAVAPEPECAAVLLLFLLALHSSRRSRRRRLATVQFWVS